MHGFKYTCCSGGPQYCMDDFEDMSSKTCRDLCGRFRFGANLVDLLLASYSSLLYLRQSHAGCGFLGITMKSQ